jgi:hypothetical protein
MATRRDLVQKARDGDRRARTVLQVHELRRALAQGCQDETDRRSFLQQVDMLEIQMASASDGEWVFAGPTLLFGLQATGRLADQLRHLPRIRAAAERAFASPSPSNDTQKIWGLFILEISHALRLGCHLKATFELLPSSVSLLAQDPTAKRLALQDLATLRFLLGDGKGAQADLTAVLAALPQGAPTEERTIITTLRDHLLDEYRPAGFGPPAPPPPIPAESDPAWPALRAVQEEASCPEATPADPRFLHIPLPPPRCSLASK